MIRVPYFAALTAVFAASAALGCGSPNVDTIGEADEAITDVVHTDVERQSIGNCWIYAEASWAESMHKAATGTNFDISQSYWTYWHWYGEITGSPSSDEVQTGGWWSTANDIVRSYGIVPEASFVPGDGGNGVERSARQSSALDTINRELKTGGRLDTFAKRSNRTLVRQVLSEAWELTTAEQQLLTSAFGADGTRTIANGRAVTTGTAIVKASAFPAAYALGPNQPILQKTLATAIGDWREVSYPSSATSRRTVQRRLQKALHDRQPAILNWFVDFNALEAAPNLPLSASFTLGKLNNNPGRQGGHMVVFEDYEAKLANGEILKAGVTLDPAKPADAQKLRDALRADTQVSFFRIKNSWGTNRTAPAVGFAGYHDLYVDYLNGPVKRCTESEALVPLAQRGCDRDTVPFTSVILPRGYFTATSL